MMTSNMVFKTYGYFWGTWLARSGRAFDSPSQGHEFKPHAGRGDYFKKLWTF